MSQKPEKIVNTTDTVIETVTLTDINQVINQIKIKINTLSNFRVNAPDAINVDYLNIALSLIQPVQNYPEKDGVGHQDFPRQINQIKSAWRELEKTLDEQQTVLIYTGGSADLAKIFVKKASTRAFPALKLNVTENNQLYGRAKEKIGTFSIPNSLYSLRNKAKKLVIVDDFIETGVKAAWINLNLKFVGFEDVEFVYLAGKPKLDHDGNPSDKFLYETHNSSSYMKPKIESNKVKIEVLSKNLVRAGKGGNIYFVIDNFAQSVSSLSKAINVLENDPEDWTTRIANMKLVKKLFLELFEMCLSLEFIE